MLPECINNNVHNGHDTYTQEKIMSDNKSGFEIRADLLNQAQSILQDNYIRSCDAIHAHNDSFPNDKKPLPTVTITAQDVIDVATQLNAFVTQK